MDDMMTIGTAPAAPSAAPTTAAPEPTPAPAIVTPESSVATTPTSEGEPPKERWADILANTRTKTRSEVEAEYREKYGWVDQFQGDPYPHLEQWLDQLSGDPEIGPKLFAKAARMLQSRRGQAQPQAETTDEPQPDVPVMDAQGNVVNQTYSAKQLKAWQEWNWQQREAALSERFGPLEAAHQKTVKSEQEAVLKAKADGEARTTLTKLREDPFFKEHEAAIKAEFAAHEEYGDNVALAALRVLSRDVLPTRDAATSAKVLSHLQTQANGASVHPSGVTTTGKPKFDGKTEDERWEQALKYFDAHPEEAAAALAKR